MSPCSEMSSARAPETPRESFSSRSRTNVALHSRRSLCYRHIGGFLAVALDQLNHSLRQFFADGDAERNSDEVGIFELNTRALIAIIQQRVQAQRETRLVNVFGRAALSGLGTVYGRHQHYKRSNGSRQRHSVGVVPLLDGRAQNALDPNAVRAHD